MTPKVVNWFGALILVGILGMVVGAAVHDIVVGEPDISNEVIALVSVAVVVLAALFLRTITKRRKRSR